MAMANQTKREVMLLRALLDPATVFYNGKPSTAYVDQPNCTIVQTTLWHGDSTNGTITLPEGSEWASKMTATIMVRTASGMEYLIDNASVREARAVSVGRPFFYPVEFHI
jgi:hypothetical protein